MPEPGEEVEARAAVLGLDQRSDHVLQGVAAVEDPQVRPAGDPGLLPEPLDGRLALGPEHLLGAGGPGPDGQLRLAEAEPPGDRQIPGGLALVSEHGPETDPIMGPDGRGPVGAACGVLVEGAGAPDVRAAAVDLGVVNRRDLIAGLIEI